MFEQIYVITTYVSKLCR